MSDKTFITVLVSAILALVVFVSWGVTVTTEQSTERQAKCSAQGGVYISGGVKGGEPTCIVGNNLKKIDLNK